MKNICRDDLKNLLTSEWDCRGDIKIRDVDL